VIASLATFGEGDDCTRVGCDNGGNANVGILIALWHKNID